MKHVTMLTTKEKAVGEVELAYPIVDGGEKLSVLYFRRPNTGDLCSMETAARLGNYEADACLISRLSGILPEAAERIDADDLARIKDGFRSFFSETALKSIEEIKANALAASAISSGMSSLATAANG